MRPALMALPDDPFPLTIEGIDAAVASIKAAAYRSTPNCVCRPKEAHIRLTGGWPASLDAARLAIRSALRGVSPSGWMRLNACRKWRGIRADTKIEVEKMKDAGCAPTLEPVVPVGGGERAAIRKRVLHSAPPGRRRVLPDMWYTCGWKHGLSLFDDFDAPHEGACRRCFACQDTIGGGRPVGVTGPLEAVAPPPSSLPRPFPSSLGES